MVAADAGDQRARSCWCAAEAASSMGAAIFSRVAPRSEDDDSGVGLLDGGLGLSREFLEEPLGCIGAAGGVEEHAQRGDVALQRGHGGERGEFGVAQDRRVEFDEALGLRQLLEEAKAAAEIHRERHDRLFADGVDRRIRDLREELLEIRVKQARPTREHRERRVVARRARGLDAFGERREDELDLVEVVAEGQLRGQLRVER